MGIITAVDFQAAESLPESRYAIYFRHFVYVADDSRVESWLKDVCMSIAAFPLALELHKTEGFG